MKPGTPAQSALKKCFFKELCVIRNCENKIQLDNAVSLHKLRISVRKTRTLLAHAKYVFPERTIIKYDREFKLLAQKTCNLRDLDVYLNALSEHIYSTRDNQQDIQNEIINFISENKIREAQNLSEYLNSAKYSKLIEDWASILDKPSSKYSRLKYANMPIQYVLKKGIIKRYQKMFQQGNEIDINSPYQKYHDLRKTCKKLRYLLEYFSDIHYKKKIRSIINELKNIQDMFGELQDYRIQIVLLNEFINTKKARNKYFDKSFNSVKLFISILDSKSQSIKSLYPERFNKLLCKLNKKIYRKIFNNFENMVEIKNNHVFFHKN